MSKEKMDEEFSLPRATIDKLIQETLKSEASMAKDAREIVREAGNIFLLAISAEANKICELEKKKTISADHIIKALEKFAFGNYIADIKKALNNYEDYSKLKPSKQNKFKDSGLTMEQLHEEQKKLFEQAKAKIEQEYNLDPELDLDIKIENVEEVEKNKLS
ncbi:hypothetical protein NUSPORA_01534 [Nucleospora cyclopteri]